MRGTQIPKERREQVYLVFRTMAGGKRDRETDPLGSSNIIMMCMATDCTLSCSESNKHPHRKIIIKIINNAGAPVSYRITAPYSSTVL